MAFRLQASGKKIEFKLKFSALNFLSNYPFLFSCISLEKQCPSHFGQNRGDQVVSLLRLKATFNEDLHTLCFLGLLHLFIKLGTIMQLKY